MESYIKTEGSRSSTWFLDSIIHSTNELVVIVNEKGIIEEISDAYSDFLGVKREYALGKNVSEIIENTRLLDVIETGVADIESTQRINGKNMIATRIPIKKNGDRKSVV